MKLQRLSQDATETRGHLIDEDANVVVCVTLERPWLDNQHDVSCIPAGSYVTKRVHSPHFGCEVFQIMDVPNRGNVLLHWGNFVTNSEGCVLLGTAFADLNGDGTIDITASKAAFETLMAKFAGVDSWPLEVVDP